MRNAPAGSPRTATAIPSAASSDDPARDRQLRGGDRDDRLELGAKAGLLRDRPAREILDFQKDDAGEVARFVVVIGEA